MADFLPPDDVDSIPDEDTIDSVTVTGTPDLTRRGKKQGAAGPLDALESNPFNATSSMYPLNLENLSHCMVFNINVQTNSKTYRNYQDFGSSRSQQLRANTILGAGTTVDVFGNTVNLTLNRKTKRIEQSIGLYVPETMIFTDAQNYETPSLLDKFGAGGVALAAGLATGNKVVEFAGIGILAGAALAPFSKTAAAATKVVNSLTDPNGTVQTAVKAGLGWAINPVIEVLYSSPQLRSFTFQFNFAPRNSQEADAVWDIIQTFRIHQAPEFLGQADAIQGAFFSPPSEFDITFMRKDPVGGGFVQNNNIPGISTCVLTNISTDYAHQNQWITFEDGMPVVTMVTMQFTELDIITRDRIQKGF